MHSLLPLQFVLFFLLLFPQQGMWPAAFAFQTVTCMFGLGRETLLLPLEESLQRRRQTLCKDKSFSDAFRRLHACVSYMYDGVGQNQSMPQTWPGLWKRQFSPHTIDNGVSLLITSVFQELLCSPVHLYVRAITKQTSN